MFIHIIRCCLTLPSQKVKEIRPLDNMMWNLTRASVVLTEIKLSMNGQWANKCNRTSGYQRPVLQNTKTFQVKLLYFEPPVNNQLSQATAASFRPKSSVVVVVVVVVLVVVVVVVVVVVEVAAALGSTKGGSFSVGSTWFVLEIA